MAGQQCKGEGTDCVRFVCGVLDELRGIKRDTPRLPQDASLHSRKTALATMKAIMRLYAPVQRVRDWTIEPGDVVVVGHNNVSPAHALIAGPRPNTLWEMPFSGQKIHYTGISLSDPVVAIYRPQDKNKWLS